MISIYMILALSLNIPVGYTGLLSIAHAAFYGIGAYVTTLFMIKTGIPFLLALLISIVSAAILSFFVSYPSIRLKGDYFILASLAFQTIVFVILYNWTDLTRGPYGITAIPRPVILGLHFDNLLMFFILSSIITLIIFFVVRSICISRFGLILKAIRDDELAALSLGKNTKRYKIIAFAVSSGIAAIAGALYATYMTYIDPTSFTLDESIFILSVLIIGGAGNLKGPVVGAVFLMLLPEGLRFLGIPDSVAANVRQVIYAMVLILLMFFRPQGLAGEYKFE